jgi:WD40 repeat protein
LRAKLEGWLPLGELPYETETHPPLSAGWWEQVRRLLQWRVRLGSTQSFVGRDPEADLEQLHQVFVQPLPATLEPAAWPEPVPAASAAGRASTGIIVTLMRRPLARFRRSTSLWIPAMTDHQRAAANGVRSAPETSRGRSIRRGKNRWLGRDSVSRGGRLLASTGDAGVAERDLTSGRQVASLLGRSSRSAFFHPTAPYLINGGADGLHRWPVRTTMGGTVGIGPSHRLTRAGNLERSAISRDGSTLAVTEGHSVRVLHFGQSSWQKQIEAQPGYRLFLDVSPDGRWIATGAWQGTGVNVWETRTRRLVKALPVNGCADVCLSPNGQWLATAAGAVSHAWRVGSWQPVFVVRRDDPEISPGSIAFTPDGSVVALERTRRVVRLIEVTTGRDLARLEAADVPLCTPLCFSQDGSLLATRGGPELLQVWDLRTIRRGLKAMKLDWSQ